MIWILLIIIGLVIYGAYNKSKKLQALGVPKGTMSFKYEGGYPKLSPGTYYVWAEDHKLYFATTKNKSHISSDEIIGISLNDNIQHVNVGGGRSVGGAVVGGIVAGPVGAIVGGKKGTKVKKIDNSKTYLNVKYNNIDVQMTFNGGQLIYNCLTSIVSKL